MDVPELQGPRSLVRSVRLFTLLAERGDAGCNLASLGEELQTPKSSLLNLLRPLVASGFVRCREGLYSLGPAMFRSAACWMAAWRFPQVVRPFLERLAERSGETVLLGVLNPEAEVLTYVEVVHGPSPVRYHVAPGTTRALHACAAGRLLLAYSPTHWRDAYLGSAQMRRLFPQPAQRAALADELARIRSEGLALGTDGLVPGVSAIAAPVLDGEGRCLAAVGIAGPSGRFAAEREHLCALVRTHAARASGLPSLHSPDFHP